MSGREIDQVEIPPTIHFPDAESIFLNLKYPKELNDSIIAISLLYDHARLRKVCLTHFFVEITCYGWVKRNCSAG